MCQTVLLFSNIYFPFSSWGKIVAPPPLKSGLVPGLALVNEWDESDLCHLEENHLKEPVPMGFHISQMTR